MYIYTYKQRSSDMRKMLGYMSSLICILLQDHRMDLTTVDMPQMILSLIGGVRNGYTIVLMLMAQLLQMLLWLLI